MIPKLPDVWGRLKEHFDNLFDDPEEDGFKDHGSGWTERVPPEWRKRLLVGGVLAVFALAGGCAALLVSDGSSGGDPSQKRYVQVRAGSDARSIGRALEKNGVVGSYYGFLLHAKLSGQEDQFKTGTYAFHEGMGYEEVIAKLVAGDTSKVKFTIPEGFGVKEIAERLDEEGIVKEQDFLEKAKAYAPYRYIERNPEAIYAIEGFLFPDTYTVESELDAEGIMGMMAGNFDVHLTPKMRGRAKEQNISIYELVTLASLVEREARYAEDRPIIAQIFFKRLSIGMPLQTDATLQYLMDAPKEDVSIEDTKMDSPYNTYQHMGLPPGPIASPGMDAIEAVLYPADTDYLYFVADREGHNHYSYTYEEHLDIVHEVR